MGMLFLNNEVQNSCN